MRGKFQVRIARQAENDLAEIWAYIATDSVDKANKFILKLEKRMKTLGNSPRRCPLIPENEILGTQYRHLILGKYRAVYRITAQTVYILRIIHGARLLDTSIIED
jgi:toxin ParE1/3/4